MNCTMKNPQECTKNFQNMVVEFLKKLCIDFVEHNKNGENHIIYGHAEKIEKIDIKFDEGVINKANAKFDNPSQIVSENSSISLFDDSIDFTRIFASSFLEKCNFYIKTENKHDFVFLPRASLDNYAAIMQKQIIDKKSVNMVAKKEDLDFLTTMTRATAE